MSYRGSSSQRIPSQPSILRPAETSDHGNERAISVNSAPYGNLHSLIMTHGSLIFVRVLRIYNVLYFLRLYSFHTFCMVWEVPYATR